MHLPVQDADHGCWSPARRLVALRGKFGRIWATRCQRLAAVGRNARRKQFAVLLEKRRTSWNVFK
eukprot:scaffold1395_cov244-Pinguiococcus_pyrenoidosus.AAC.2